MFGRNSYYSLRAQSRGLDLLGCGLSTLVTERLSRCLQFKLYVQGANEIDYTIASGIARTLFSQNVGYLRAEKRYGH